MTDTHVHLNSDVLFADLDAVIERARAAGVHTQIVVGYDRASSARAVEIARASDGVFAVVGLHPHDARGYNAVAESDFREWASDPRVVAIGEIGLDYYRGVHGERDLASPSVQERAFVAQLHLARDVGLPVVIHCREAYDDCIALLEAEAGDLTVILHCFAGSEEQATRAVGNGWLLGVDGPVTYRKNVELREIVASVPIESLLLETDAPYLSPEPLRGRFPNEPARLPHIAKAVADARRISLEELVAATDENARRAFPRLNAAG
jgi:TatD DNase family protein